MAKIDIHTFIPNDFENFTPQKMQEHEYELFKSKGDRLMDYLEEESNTVTVQLDGKNIAIFGIFPLPERGCHGWLFFSKDIGNTGMVIATRMLKGMFSALKEMGYEWIQTPVRTDFKQGERMMKMLGFSGTDIVEDLLEDGTKYKYWMKVL